MEYITEQVNIFSSKLMLEAYGLHKELIEFDKD